MRIIVTTRLLQGPIQSKKGVGFSMQIWRKTRVSQLLKFKSPDLFSIHLIRSNQLAWTVICLKFWKIIIIINPLNFSIDS